MWAQSHSVCLVAASGWQHQLTSAAHAQVIVAGRSTDRCEEAVAEIKKETGQSAGKLDVLEVDLASFRSVLPFVRQSLIDYSCICAMQLRCHAVACCCYHV